MEDQHPGCDEDLDPGDYAANRAESAAYRLARPKDRSSSGWGEGLLDPLPPVFSDVAPEQQAVRVVPAPFVLAGFSSAPHGSLEQEVPECSQRQGDWTVPASVDT